MNDYQKYKLNRKLVKYIPKSIKEINDKKQADSIAIIVPFRDPEENGVRSKHLEYFLKYYSLFKPKNKEIFIYIIEQSKDGRKFNRGALLNVGFKLAKKHNPSMYIFHDVDLISSPDLIPLYFTVSSIPIHIGRLWKEKYNFYTYLGGIISMDKKSYEKINGFPNNFWNWGGEDDAMYNRLAATNTEVILPKDDNNAVIKGLPHEDTSKLSKQESHKKKENILRDLKFWRHNGVNNIRFEILSRKFLNDNIFQITVKL